jgi:hypothetical protein
MIDAYCNDEATLIISGGYKDSRPLTPTPQTIKTKYFDKRKLMTDRNGQQVISSGYFLIPKDIILTNEDKIKIDSVTYVIMAIEKAKDFSQSHYKVWVQ